MKFYKCDLCDRTINEDDLVKESTTITRANEKPFGKVLHYHIGCYNQVWPAIDSARNVLSKENKNL